MVVVKGGGSTYQMTSGKIVAWDDVPDSFKQLMSEQKEIEQCTDQRKQVQQCIEDKGFWPCAELTEAFHLCQGNALRSELRNSKGPAESVSH